MNELNAVIEKLADKLSIPVGRLWDALLRQALIDGIASLFQYAIICALLYGIFRYWKWFTKSDLSEDGELGYAILGGAFSIVGLIFFFVGFAYFPTFIAAFLNPEYWALMKILGR